MDKRTYSAPHIKRVKLELKNAILSSCNQSPTIMDPRVGTVACNIAAGCFNPN